MKIKILVNYSGLRHVQYVFVALLILATIFIGPAQAFAAGKCQTTPTPGGLTQISPADCAALWGNWVNWNNEVVGGVCSIGGQTNLTGSGNAEKIYNYFTGPGHDLTPFQAAGIMGNMQAESGLNPRALEPGTTGDAPITGRGYGLVQWTFADRQQPLIDRAAAAGKPVFNLGVQLDYVWWEMTASPSYSTILAQLKATTDIVSATRLIEDKYEIHAGGPQPARITNARKFLALYGSNAPGAPSDTSNTSGNTTNCASGDGNSDITGGFSLPAAKSFYLAHSDWFTKPHHDYPAADIPVPSGTKIFAMTDGKITKAPMGTSTTGYGLGVQIDAGNGITFIYGHGIDGGTISGAAQGDTVTAGQLIMHSGNTGHSFGAHLHLEIRVNGVSVCPQSLFVAIAEGKPIPDIKSLPTTGCTY